MLIGVDFDNTIVCYDALFHKVAREGNFIPADVPINKSDVRNYLRKIGKEDVWTEMQGYVYGGRMSEAAPYPGVIEFFQQCRTVGIEVRIISHKTRHPFLGKQYDLHEAAYNWLELQGFFDSARIGLPRENAFFELTKELKLRRIDQCGCTHFIDDLPEFLGEASFPIHVERILFDPNNLYAHEKFVRIQQWQETKNIIFSKKAEVPAELPQKAGKLFRSAGIGSDSVLMPLAGGGNNRVYQIGDGPEKRVLKVYFQNATDPRNRFGAEKSFYNFLWHQGIRRTPEPMGWDDEYRLGLFGFIDGRKLVSSEVQKSFITQAIQFIVELNQGRPSASSLPAASEACFSIAEHVTTIERRVSRLKGIEAGTATDAEAAEFVGTALHPAWAKIKQSIEATAGNRLEVQLSSSDKCLSPSDFGFHNALLPSDGKLRFFDFEYAGWDDPAKLCCDFFCQPQIPVPLAHWNHFVTSMAPLFAHGFTERARLLLPAYQIKWCCIMLNEFVRTEQARRDFAKGAHSSIERKAAQLQKARHALAQVAQLPFPAGSA